jgi:hypothetical protein
LQAIADGNHWVNPSAKIGISRQASGKNVLSQHGDETIHAPDETILRPRRKHPETFGRYQQPQRSADLRKSARTGDVP